MGISSNIMSLAGIAISIGVLVDGAIVEVENAYKKLELWNAGGRQGDFHEVRLEALLEVGPSVFFSLLVIAVAFLPVFTLRGPGGPALQAARLDQEPRHGDRGRSGAHPRPRHADALHAHGLRARSGRAGSRGLWNQATVGRYYPEEKHPISRVLFAIYEPAVPLRAAPAEGHDRDRLVLMAATVPVYLRLGHEFMPPLNEGTHPLHADDAARHLA